MKEQEEVLKWEAENDLIWVDEFEFDLDNVDKARVLQTGQLQNSSYRRSKES